MNPKLEIKDIRKGNKILSLNDEVCVVFHLDSEENNDCVRDRINYVGIDNYKPMPITNQNLIESGFVQDNILFFKKNNPRFKIILDGNGICSIYYKDVFLCATKQFHKLQNIYRDLFYEEFISH
jgi:hypothetical protein